MYWRDQYILSKYKTASFKEKEKYFEQLSSRNEDSFLDYSYSIFFCYFFISSSNHKRCFYSYQ